MRKKDEIQNPESCWNKAKDDENLFVLLGRDRSAPYTIRCWANERIRIGKNRYDDPQITEALALADDIELQHLRQDQAEGANDQAQTC